jgi:predicted RNA binding protein YcfA (HicA-like mRNA interferase family)
MGSLPGIQHLQAIRVFEKAGFRVARQGKHVIMTDGARVLVIPRNNPINAFTMADIVKNSGLTTEQFRKLL